MIVFITLHIAYEFRHFLAAQYSFALYVPDGIKLERALEMMCEAIAVHLPPALYYEYLLFC